MRDHLWLSLYRIWATNNIISTAKGSDTEKISAVCGYNWTILLACVECQKSLQLWNAGSVSTSVYQYPKAEHLSIDWYFKDCMLLLPVLLQCCIGLCTYQSIAPPTPLLAKGGDLISFWPLNMPQISMLCRWGVIQVNPHPYKLACGMVPGAV